MENMNNYNNYEKKINVISDMFSNYEMAVLVVGHNLPLSHDEKRQFFDEVAYGDGTGAVDLVKKTIQMAKQEPNYQQMVADVALNAMFELHKEWVGTRCEYKETRAVRDELGDNFYLIGPIELVGWDFAKEYLALIQPVLETVDIQVDEEVLKRAYDERAVKLLERCDSNHRQYVRDMESGDVYPITYDNLGQLIVNEYAGNNLFGHLPTVEHNLIPALLERGFGKDDKLMAIIEEKDIDFGQARHQRDDHNGYDTPGNR